MPAPALFAHGFHVEKSLTMCRHDTPDRVRQVSIIPEAYIHPLQPAANVW